jgi:hypothetical protein
MPDPTTLVAFAEERHTHLTGKLSTARTEAAEAQTVLLGASGKAADLDNSEEQLAQKQAELAALPEDATDEMRTALMEAIEQLQKAITELIRSIGARKLVEHRVQQVAALEASLEKTRKQIAQSPTGADADALADLLTQHSIDHAAASGKLLQAENHLTGSQIAFDLAQRRLERTSAALARAKSLLDDETQRKTQHDAMIQSLQEEPLSKLRNRAAQILASAKGEASDAGGDEDLAKAIDAARLAKERIEADLSAELLNPLIVRADAALDALEAERAALETAEKSLAEHRKTTEGAAAAVAAFQAVFEKADAALAAYVRQGQSVLQIATGLFGGIVASPPLTAPQKAAIGDVDLSTGRRKAAVPHHVWMNLIHFLRAKRMLAQLAADPQDLTQARQEAEKKLTEELVKEAATTNTLDERLDDVWRKQRTAPFAESVGQRRVFEAIRGES